MGADGIRIDVCPGGFDAFAEADLAADAVALCWLGQAGFALRTGGRLVLIDPYLSDSLARKYAGKEFAHTRMMPIPVAPDALPPVDVVFCTHRHSDHMDPGTLPLIARAHPDARFVAPRAELASARSLGLPEDRIIATDAGERLEPVPGLRATVLASAHEDLKQDAEGRHHFLGYVLDTEVGRIYHSGDCTPYPGLVETLAPLGIDLALLPVNGRDAFRRERGVPGNMTFDEAVAICERAGVPHLVPHHFGMFAFNTVDVADLRRAAASSREVRVHIPDANAWMTLHRAADAAERLKQGDAR